MTALPDDWHPRDDFDDEDDPDDWMDERGLPLLAQHLRAGE